jgi:hypothetical protein
MPQICVSRKAGTISSRTLDYATTHPIRPTLTASALACGIALACQWFNRRCGGSETSQNELPKPRNQQLVSRAWSTRRFACASDSRSDCVAV